jgi:hypothetical protein
MKNPLKTLGSLIWKFVVSPSLTQRTWKRTLFVIVWSFYAVYWLTQNNALYAMTALILFLFNADRLTEHWARFQYESYRHREDVGLIDLYFPKLKCCRWYPKRPSA